MIIQSLDKSLLAGVDDVSSFEIQYIYPPRKNSMVMSDGLTSEMFQKRNMEQELRKKVKRKNKLAMEIQGSVILTRKN